MFDVLVFENKTQFPCCCPGHMNRIYFGSLIYLFQFDWMTSHVLMNLFYYLVIYYEWRVFCSHNLGVFSAHGETYFFWCFIKAIPSAKRRWLRCCSSIFTPFSSQVNFLNTSSRVSLKSFGEIVSLCCTLFFMLIFCYVVIFTFWHYKSLIMLGI